MRKDLSQRENVVFYFSCLASLPKRITKTSRRSKGFSNGSRIPRGKLWQIFRRMMSIWNICLFSSFIRLLELHFYVDLFYLIVIYVGQLRRIILVPTVQYLHSCTLHSAAWRWNHEVENYNLPEGSTRILNTFLSKTCCWKIVEWSPGGGWSFPYFLIVLATNYSLCMISTFSA